MGTTFWIVGGVLVLFVARAVTKVVSAVQGPPSRSAFDTEGKSVEAAQAPSSAVAAATSSGRSR